MNKGADQRRKQLRASLHSEGNGSERGGHCRGRSSGRFGCAENKEAERWMTRASAGRFKKAQIWELAGHVDNGGDRCFCEVEA